MLADALARQLLFIVTADQVGHITQAPALLEDQIGNAVLADKAPDSNDLREQSPPWESRRSSHQTARARSLFHTTNSPTSIATASSGVSTE
jgi:hypothetical protein